MRERILNARITNTVITMREQATLTFHVFFEGQCSAGIGGYCIGHGYLGADEFTAGSSGLVAMMKIMDTVGVDCWEDLKGKYIRVVDPGLGNPVTKIGNIIEDKWFDIDAFFEYERSKQEAEDNRNK